ncbi:MAG TPA: gamma-glutamyltransferase family protein [Ideonella sp.]|uniref:gamma-glutamyltransferase family protein n=1 Tax=Ideonella sp. TaxID=1929293 RepID=UPI002CBCFD40|nr:gamma-glutamyltransferase family protein [Ideonella sp.]HSI48098.1 gamma-glutamyltransferase family protein [Ideonella sp.]
MSALPLRFFGRCAAGLLLGLLSHAAAAKAPLPILPASAASEAAPVAMPEAATGFTAKPGWYYPHAAVAAANPLAADAGARMLREGGSAADAAVAVQMVLGLVEPQSSGIGGGGFLLYWDGKQVQAWDGRETAPAAADEKLFLRPDGQPSSLPGRPKGEAEAHQREGIPMSMGEAVPGGRAVGVPGVLRMLEAMHREHGKLPWARLFQPAIELAEAGFELTPRPVALLAEADAAKRDPAARAFYYQPGPPGADPQPWPVGHRLRNPALAEILRRIAKDGSAAFYQGPVATDLVRRVRGHPSNPGRITEADLAAYQPIKREAICTDWRAVWRVCGVPPPSSGHIAMMQILGMLDELPPLPGKPLDAGGLPSPAFLHRYVEASRLAFADRAQFLGDPAFVAAPAGGWQSLLAPAYLRQRALLIGERAATSPVAAGRPGDERGAYAPQAEQPEYGTSHISIVDAQGNAVSFTTTVEASFGTGLLADGGTGLAGGYILNNQLTDFSFRPTDAQGRPVANRVQPGKRPRSSMSPTLVFDRRDGRLQLSTGAAGGAVIIHYTAKVLLGMLAWDLDPQQAANLPNFGNFNGSSTLLETGRFPPATVQALSQRGQQVQRVDLTSGIQALQRRKDGWVGGADPRREGEVRGH